MARWIRVVAVMAVVLSLALGTVVQTQAQADRRVRELILLSRPQAADPQEFESGRLLVQEFAKLGLQVTLRPMPWEQQADYVWYSRDKWDITMWRMVGRPERSDPDEFAVNLFHESTAEKGYNFVGYTNRTYSRIADAQRIMTDAKKRQQLVFEAQRLIARDVPYVFLLFPHSVYVYNKSVWDPRTVVEQKDIGLKNF